MRKMTTRQALKAASDVLFTEIDSDNSLSDLVSLADAKDAQHLLSMLEGQVMALQLLVEKRTGVKSDDFRTPGLRDLAKKIFLGKGGAQ